MPTLTLRSVLNSKPDPPAKRTSGLSLERTGTIADAALSAASVFSRKMQEYFQTYSLSFSSIFFSLRETCT